MGPGFEGTSLGTPNARRIIRRGIEGSRGGMMAETLLEVLADIVAVGLAGYREDVGDGVWRRIKIIKASDDNDYIDVETRLTGQRDPEHRYRIRLAIEELPW
jgi:hypothetical protein